ncbi:N-acetylmuramate alpha-1-phosphate uridylyltransferase MurU [Paucibacter sp. JuS9]|uniref:N-acetylmuramate alpha-1-phosphate uridylyltransferase MurU n=1 Tax=Paucibacter sp. JuS9 TaxID=3228748 RepID=UPI0037579F80
MRAIILAAGRGERMRPLTDHTPKPLLKARGKPLIEWHIEALARAGVQDIVINCAWLEEQFPAVLGDGSRWGLRLHYCFEQQRFGGALETGGGIATALPLLGADGDAAFWAVSGDIYMPGFEFDPAKAAAFAASEQLAHLWMVPTQAQHPQGDFAIDADGHVRADGGPLQVFANIGLYRPALFGVIRAGERQRMRVALDHGIALGRITAELHDGPWINVGTPEQLDALNAT